MDNEPPWEDGPVALHEALLGLALLSIPAAGVVLAVALVRWAL